MADKQSLEKRFEDLRIFIESATNDAEKGKIKDMKPLEREVEALCKDVEQSKPETATQMKPVLADMIERLDHLADAIQAQQKSA